MNTLNHTNLAELEDIKTGDILALADKSGNLIVYQCKDILNPGSGKEEVLLSVQDNKYFNWSMYESGESWVWRVWNLGPGNIHAVQRKRA